MARPLPVVGGARPRAAAPPAPGAPAPSLREWLGAAPFTLALSGGFFGFFAHTGLLLALEEAGLRPSRLVGVSAGALAGGLWAAGLEAPRMAEALGALRKQDFWDPGLPLGGLIKGRRFVGLLQRHLAAAGLSDRLEATAIPFGAVVHDLLRRRARLLERGSLPVAIRASCSVPLLFRPVRWGRTLLVDGGVSDRAGLGAVAPGERVLLHHLLPTGIDAAFSSATPGVGRRECVTISVPALPRVGPDRLANGPRALAQTRDHVARRLASPARASS